MSTEFVLPILGDGIDGGTIVKVLVNVGDSVDENQNVLELETDKAVLEVPSNVSGTVEKIAAKEGTKINVGDLVFSVSGAAKKAEPEKKPAAETETETKQSTQPAPPTNRSARNQVSAPSALSTPISVPERSDGAAVPAAPSTRRFARELGVDVYEVAGTGPGGRISQDDIKTHVRHAIQGGNGSSAGTSAAHAALPDFSKFGEIETEEFSNVRRATSTQMSRAWNAPHVTQFDQADITSIETARKKYSAQAEKRGGKLTVTAVLIKVIVAALKKYPQFNASLDLANQQVIYKKYFNVGVAVDTPRGLLVPVVKNANAKGIFEIAAELGEIAERARNKKTSLEEMSGGCFTLTNLGGIGGTAFTPIINVPEVAILGVARGGFEPVWNKEKNEFKPRMILPLCLSYDHRVIDGADGARFLRFIAETLQDPFLLALEG